MARIDCYSAESFYFCGVKTQMRHEVAGSASVFRANNLLGKLYPNDGGSSNARKGLAFETLTHRIGVLLCQKIMETNAKQLQDAQQKVVESIQEYLSDFHSVAVMHERTAKALIEIILVSNHLSEEARKMIRAMVEDHVCLLDLIKPLDEKGGEV
jgi:hypothetical protein